MPAPLLTPKSQDGLFLSLGLMSGTSMDGIDVALLATDGDKRVEPLGFDTIAYEPSVRDRLRALLSLGSNEHQWPPSSEIAQLERLLTQVHIDAVQTCLTRFGSAARACDVIGFHGHTLIHDPAHARTIALGDGPLLATATGIPVVYRLRENDVAHGGQGAPLAPAYHWALARRIGVFPICFVNIGGISNLTWCEEGAPPLAWDCGPGNALLDDWMFEKTGRAMDQGGACARGGGVERTSVEAFLSHPYFDRPPPKSLDRRTFSRADFEGCADLSVEDGAATLLEGTVLAIARSQTFFPKPAKYWVICGGGRHNTQLLERLRIHLTGEIVFCEDVGYNGDALEAEAWAYLAVRHLKGLVLSWPSTTGVRGEGGERGVVGGVLVMPS